ncbi:hypothetical protein F4779DRAFT_253122 [Xylariaceae sp. FL0662B]|nr:hypothetical protein F4779DRAFT_253122 [Xylariaceae sp. FL0662B]
MSPNQLQPSKDVNDARSRQPSKRMIEASHDQSRHSFASYTTGEDDQFLDADEPCFIEEATVMNAKEVTVEAPALPQRSSLRASRLLDSLKLDSIESATQSLTGPHDIYLSSEEDASSSADDFSDYDYDSGSEGSEKSPLRRRSQEDTARAVSVIYIGKPCIVDLASGRRSASPIRRPRAIYEGSSSSVDTNSLGGRQSHPSRKTGSVSSIDTSRKPPSFLDQDPFAAGNYKLDSASNGIAAACNSPRIPKSPTGPLHRFQKSLSLARRRSRPNLKDTFSRDNVVSMPGSTSTTNLHLTLDTSQVPEKNPKRPEPQSAITMPSQLPMTSNEFASATSKSSRSHRLSSQSSYQPISPISPAPTGKRGILSGLNMKRRQSVRIKP